MRAARTSDDRVIQWHASNLTVDGAIALQKRIVKYIAQPRIHPVGDRQIVAWFRATDPEFVRAQLDAVVADGRVLKNELVSGRVVYRVPGED